MGALLTGILATEKVNPVVATVKQGLFMNQIKAVLVTLVLSVVATTIIAFIVKAILGLRPSEEVESLGLDLAEHGEEAYTGGAFGGSIGGGHTPERRHAFTHAGEVVQKPV